MTQAQADDGDEEVTDIGGGAVLQGKTTHQRRRGDEWKQPHFEAVEQPPKQAGGEGHPFAEGGDWLLRHRISVCCAEPGDASAVCTPHALREEYTPPKHHH